MKLVILVDSTESFERIIELVDTKNILVINTENSCEEYRHLDDTVKEFSKSESVIMLGRVSGDETIKQLGDNMSEMIIGLSSNKDSMYYIEEPCNVLSELITLFEKEEASL